MKQPPDSGNDLSGPSDVPEPTRDNIFARPLTASGRFVFDDQVARVFPDMIRRSVPGYESIITMTGTLAERFATPESRCYDLGCSLGASLLALADNTAARHCEIIGIDNSPAMLARCRQVLERSAVADRVRLECQDVQSAAIANASVVVLNFTLQFVPIAERQALLDRIWVGLNPGGILVVSEKVSFEDAHHHQLMIDLHHNFKRSQGYSELEISQKRSALENVLIPETLDAHRRRLRRAGFLSVDVWFQCFNFASLLAIKTRSRPDAGARRAKP